MRISNKQTISKLLNASIILAFVIFYFIVSNKLGVIKNEHFELKRTSILQTDSINQILEVVRKVNLVKSFKVQDCSLISTSTNECVNLFSLLNNVKGVSIIYRLIETGCGSCNKKQIEFLNKIQKINNLIVLTYPNSARYLRLLANSSQIQNTMYQLEISCKLFKSDDKSKILIMYVNNKGTILRAYFLNEESLFLIKNIVPSAFNNIKN